MSHNDSYVSSALNTANASGNLTDAKALGFTKFGDVFAEHTTGDWNIACGSSQNCVISCSCNEANEWYDSTSKTGANYISVSTNRSYAFTSSSSSASTANAKKTCYHKASKCPDGYYYYETAPNVSSGYYLYTKHTSTTKYPNCYKVSCGGDITYPDPTKSNDKVTHISVEDADTYYTDKGLISGKDPIADGYGIKCYYPKWPTHIVYEIEGTRNGANGVYTDSFSTVKAKAYRGTEDVSDRFAMIVDNMHFGEVATGYDCTKAIGMAYHEETMERSTGGGLVINQTGEVALTPGNQAGSSCAFGNNVGSIDVQFNIDQTIRSDLVGFGINTDQATKQPLMYYGTYKYYEATNQSATLYHNYSITPSIHAPVAFIDKKITSTQVFDTSKPLVQNALKQSGGSDAPWGDSPSGTGVENKVIHVLPKVNITSGSNEEIYFDITAYTLMTVDLYSDRTEYQNTYSIIVNPDEISTDNIKVKIYYSNTDSDSYPDSDDFVDIHSTSENCTFCGGISGGYSIYNKETNKYDALEYLTKMEVYIGDELVHTTTDPQFYTVENDNPETQTFIYDRRRYRIVAEKYVEEHKHNCEPGYFSEKPDSNIFNFETKNGCYKTTSCKETGLISATKDTKCTSSLKCKEPSAVSSGGKTCYINWPSYVIFDVGLNCGNKYVGDVCSGVSGERMSCFLDDRKSGVYWARGNTAADFGETRDLLYKISVEDNKDLLYLKSVNMDSKISGSLSFFGGYFGISVSHVEIAETLESPADFGDMDNLVSATPRVSGNDATSNLVYECSGDRGFSESQTGDNVLNVKDNMYSGGYGSRYYPISGHTMTVCFGSRCIDLPVWTHLNAYPLNGQL